MPAPISLDLRKRVLADFRAGPAFAQLGRTYSVGAEWSRRFIGRFQAAGGIAARPPLGKKLPFHRRRETGIRAAVAGQPDPTLEIPRARLGVEVGLATLHAALRAPGISCEEKRWPPRSARGPTSSGDGRNSTPRSRLAPAPAASFSPTKPGSKPT